MSAWTSPADICRSIARRWEKGGLLARAETVFPLAIRLKGPTPAELGQRLAEVQAWVALLRAGSRAALGHGYELRFTTVNSRQLGANQVPVEALVSTLDDALRLIAKQDEHMRWSALKTCTHQICPALLTVVDAEPLLVIEQAVVWERCLTVVAWMLQHPRPGMFLRQIDLPGVDSKFVERHESLLRRLLDQVMPAGGVDRMRQDFAGRFGFRRKPDLIQLRLLDPALAIQGMSHIAAPSDQLAQLRLPVRRVIITENEINGLALPDLSGTATIFGLGYAIDALGEFPWVRNAEQLYWGDIDTHGFAILSRLRSHLPRVRSLLMDEATLLAHRSQWVEEPDQVRSDALQLSQEEQHLYQGLVRQRWGASVRLEQERIAFTWITEQLSRA